MMGNPGIPGQSGLDVSFQTHSHCNHVSSSRKVTVDIYTQRKLRSDYSKYLKLR